MLGSPSHFKHICSPVSTGGTITNPNAAAAKRAAKFDKDSNEVHLFSHNREEVWDGYDSTLTESNEEEYNLVATPPEEEAKVAATAAEETEQEQVCQSFWHLDIEEHEKKL